MKRLRIYSPVYFLTALCVCAFSVFLISWLYSQSIRNPSFVSDEIIASVIFWAILVMHLGFPFLICLLRIEIVTLDKIMDLGPELHFIIPPIIFGILFIISLSINPALLVPSLLATATFAYWYGFLYPKWVGMSICTVAAIAISIMTWMFIYFE